MAENTDTSAAAAAAVPGRVWNFQTPMAKKKAAAVREAFAQNKVTESEAEALYNEAAEIQALEQANAEQQAKVVELEQLIVNLKQKARNESDDARLQGSVLAHVKVLRCMQANAVEGGNGPKMSMMKIPPVAEVSPLIVPKGAEGVCTLVLPALQAERGVLAMPLRVENQETSKRQKTHEQVGVNPMVQNSTTNPPSAEVAMADQKKEGEIFSSKGGQWMRHHLVEGANKIHINVSFVQRKACTGKAVTSDSDGQEQKGSPVGAEGSPQGTDTVLVNAKVSKLTATRQLSMDECTHKLRPYRLPILPGKAGGEDTKMLADSGAQLSLVSEKCVKQWLVKNAQGIEIADIPTAYRLEVGTWAEEAYGVKQVAIIPITTLGETQDCTFLIVPSAMDVPLLLGLDSLHRLGISVHGEDSLVKCVRTGQEFSYKEENHVWINQAVIRKREEVTSQQPLNTWRIKVVEENSVLEFRHECPTNLQVVDVEGNPIHYTGYVLGKTSKEATGVGVALDTWHTYVTNGWVCAAIPHLGETMSLAEGCILGTVIPLDDSTYVNIPFTGRKNA